MFQTDLLSIIRSLNIVHTAIGICHASYVDSPLAFETPDKRQQICLKHVEFCIKINFGNLYLVGFYYKKNKNVVLYQVAGVIILWGKEERINRVSSVNSLTYKSQTQYHIIRVQERVNILIQVPAADIIFEQFKVTIVGNIFKSAEHLSKLPSPFSQLSICNSSVMKHENVKFYEQLYSLFNFNLDQTILMTTLHEDIQQLLHICTTAFTLKFGTIVKIQRHRLEHHIYTGVNAYQQLHYAYISYLVAVIISVK